VTSTTYNGNLGGILGANTKCAARAAAASLSGSYFAWIGEGTGAPDTNFTKVAQPYYLVDGTTLIAGSYLTLTNGTPLAHAIDRDEFGAAHFDYVWTGVNANGTAATSSCQNWSSASSPQLGLVGSTGEINADWTAAGGISCNQSRRLYCFGQ
jgi:Protein of unknown function (DUF1554)